MKKTQALTAEDMVRIYRLIGECRDLGFDAGAWRRSLLDGLLKHVGGVVGVLAAYRDCQTPRPRVEAAVEVGWSDPQARAYYQRHVEECGMGEDPHWRIFAQQYRACPALQVMDRQQAVRDREWFLSVHFNEFRKPAGSGSSLYDCWPASQANPNAMVGMALTRALGESEFSEYDRQFCRWLFHELGPLIGKQLAAPGEPSLADLSPRLRQTLQCLLEGDSEKQAAVRLGVSKDTVHEYVKMLYRRFDVSSRGELLARWLRFDCRGA